MKSGLFAALALTAAGAGLTACGREKLVAPAGQQATGAVTVANARLVLPAVKGNPGAIYFDVTNAGSADVAFGSVEVEGAQGAMMHATNGGAMADLARQSVKVGETVKFAPGGLHVMAMGLADTLRAGGTTHVTLHFNNGDRLTFPAQIVAAGDAR